MGYEIFCDKSYYDYWTVRPKGDRDWNSPLAVSFNLKKDAEEFKEKLEKGLIVMAHPQK